jgi:hypothetical protein
MYSKKNFFLLWIILGLLLSVVCVPSTAQGFEDTIHYQYGVDYEFGGKVNSEIKDGDNCEITFDSDNQQFDIFIAEGFSGLYPMEYEKEGTTHAKFSWTDTGKTSKYAMFGGPMNGTFDIHVRIRIIGNKDVNQAWCLVGGIIFALCAIIIIGYLILQRDKKKKQSQMYAGQYQQYPVQYQYPPTQPYQQPARYQPPPYQQPGPYQQYPQQRTYYPPQQPPYPPR